LIYLTIFTLLLSFGVLGALAQDFNFNLSDNKGNSSFDLSFFCLSKDSLTEDISSSNNSVTNQSALMSSSFDSNSGTDSEKQHKKKKSDMGDETLSSDLSPAFNIEQSPLASLEYSYFLCTLLSI
jgi:hypothetical protein